MLKNIFRNKLKSSKSGLVTPSTKDTKYKAHFHQKLVGSGRELPVSVVQLNNETGHHSERAIDVLPEKQTNVFLSSPDTNNAAIGRGMRSASVESIPKNEQFTPLHKEVDKENVNHVQNEMASVVSKSYQKYNLAQNDLDTLVAPRQQWQAVSTSVPNCAPTEVVKQFNGSPDVMLIEDGENSEDELPPLLATAEGSGKDPSCTNSLQPGRLTHIAIINSQPCGNNIAMCNDNDTSYFDDAIPQLVPINGCNDSVLCQTDKKQVPSHAIETASSRINCRPDAPGDIGNESQMYILTDSFLDYSSASFVNAVNRTSSSDVMVADDYTSVSLVQSKQQRLLSLNAALLPTRGGNLLSWACSDESALEQPVAFGSEFLLEENKAASQIAINAKSTWQQKPVQEWSSEEVLMWVEDVGLVDYYETFQSNKIVGRDLSVISIKLLDRLEVFGQNERERVLSCLYRLHSSGFGSRQTNSHTILPSFQLPKSQISLPFTDSEISSLQSTQLECGSQCSTDIRVVKQLNFDEKSLAPSTNDAGSSCCQSGSFSFSDNSSNTTAASSSRQTTTSACLTVIPSEKQSVMDSREETRECENALLLEKVSMLEKVVLAKESLVEALTEENSDLKTELLLHSVQPASDGQSLHHVLSTNSTGPIACVVAVSLTVNKNSSNGFMLGLDASQRPIIKHVEPNIPLKKGDRLLEVNGCYVLHLSEQQLYKLLQSYRDSLEIVVLRPSQDSPRQLHTSDEFEALKVDLHLALMECEAVQQENADLATELNRLKKDCGNVEEVDFESSMDEISALDDY